MLDFNERLARNVAKYFIVTLVDEVGKFIVGACGKKAGPVTSTLDTGETKVRFSIHLDDKEKKESEEKV